MPGEHRYLDLQSLFKIGELPNWNESESMIEFFKSCVVASELLSPLAEAPESGVSGAQGLKYEKVRCGYMDDPLNTDHAWREIELWHFHYTSAECLADKMQSSQIHWRFVTEDVFTKLPLGQATLMQDLTNKLHPAIL